MLVTETFEGIVTTFSGTEAYTALCAKVLPSLTGALSVGDVTNDNPLVEVSAFNVENLPWYGADWRILPN